MVTGVTSDGGKLLYSLHPVQKEVLLNGDYGVVLVLGNSLS